MHVISQPQFRKRRFTSAANNVEYPEPTSISLAGRKHEEIIQPGARARAEVSFSGTANAQQELRITSDQVWQPSEDGLSNDQRLLSFKIVSMKLVHKRSWISGLRL